MQISEIATKTDLEKVKEELISAVKEIFSQTSATSKKWLKTEELKRLLGLSSSGIQNLRINGTIPYTKLGGVIYYDFSEIVKILETNKSKALANNGSSQMSG